MPLDESNATQQQLEGNRALVTRYFEEVWNQGRLEVLEELLSPHYLNHSASTSNPRPGPEDLKPIVAHMREAIPDLHYGILDMVVAPDKVAAYLRVTGTQRDALWGMPASGKRLDVRQMQIEWVEGGRITQHWRVTDELGMLRQLGLL